MLTQGHDEFLWRQAAELLQIGKLLEGQPQEGLRQLRCGDAELSRVR